MIYSCFDAQRADYLVFEDDRRLLVNGDLPVPQFQDTGRIGVPSIDAARPLPTGARQTGRSWRARGLIVKCPKRTGILHGLSEFVDGGGSLGPLVMAGGVVLGVLVTRHFWKG